MNFEQVCELLQEFIIDKDRKIEKNNLLKEDLGLCSFDMMVIITEIEEKTGNKVDLSKLCNEKTVEGLITSIITD